MFDKWSEPLSLLEMKAHAYIRRASVLLIYYMVVAMEVTGNRGNPSGVFGGKRVINVGAFFTYNSTIGRSVKPALVAAIEDVNSDKTILNGTKLNLILQDTNCSGFLGTVEGKKLYLNILKVYLLRNSCLFYLTNEHLCDYYVWFLRV